MNPNKSNRNRARKRRRIARSKFESSLVSFKPQIAESVAKAYLRMLRHHVGQGVLDEHIAKFLASKFRDRLKQVMMGVPGNEVKGTLRVGSRHLYVGWENPFKYKDFISRLQEKELVDKKEAIYLHSIKAQSIDVIKELHDVSGGKIISDESYDRLCKIYPDKRSRNELAITVDICDRSQTRSKRLESGAMIELRAAARSASMGGGDNDLVDHEYNLELALDHETNKKKIDRNNFLEHVVLVDNLQNQKRCVVVNVNQWKVRDSGKGRGTCVAFAVTAALEHFYHSNQGEKLCLSEQFLHWSTKDIEPEPLCLQDGTHPGWANKSLKTHGICWGNDWQYDQTVVVNNPGHQDHPVNPRPTSHAKHHATRRRHDWLGYVWFPVMEPQMLATYLYHQLAMKNRPAIAIIKKYRMGRISNWEEGEGVRTGKVEGWDQFPEDVVQSDGAHAVLIVGFIPDKEARGGGYFVFRNCWGETWSRPSSYGRPLPNGYGLISAGSLIKSCSRLWFVKS